jgi:hypothetical protein
MATTTPATTAGMSEARRFDELVKEEEAIHTASLPFSGGVPSCLTLFDRLLACYSPSTTHYVILQNAID